MSLSEKFLLPLYSTALRLYPRAFRSHYTPQMIDAARISYSESDHPLRLTASLARDLAISLPREHWRAAHATPGYVAAFGALITVTLFIVSVVYQQVLRRGANDQPQHIVASIVDRTAQGDDPASLIPGIRTEIDDKAWLNSSQPFVALYDNSGNAIIGDATLHGRLPQPPRGIFQHARLGGKGEITWQPEPGIRIATVTRLLPNGGFVLAGQSLIIPEERTLHFHMLLIWAWLATLAILAATMAAVHRRAT